VTLLLVAGMILGVVVFANGTTRADTPATPAADEEMAALDVVTRTQIAENAPAPWISPALAHNADQCRSLTEVATRERL